MRKKRLENIIVLIFTIAMCIQRITMAVSSILFGVSICLFLFYVWKYKDQVCETCRKRKIKVYVILHILFVCSLIPSLIGTDRIGVSVREFFNLGLYHVMPFIMVMVMDLNEKQIVKMFIAFFVVEAMECSVAMYETITEYNGPGTRGDGFDAKGLFLPGMLSFAVPLCGMLFVEQRFNKQLRNCALLTFPFLVGGVWAANSRAGMLIFLLNVFIMASVYLFKGKNVWIKVCSVLVIFLVCGGMFIYRGDRVRSAADFSGGNSSNNIRILLWKSSMEMMKDHPFTGVGLGNWRRAYKQRYLPAERRKTSLVKMGHSHSSYMHIGGQTGWPGFVGLIIFHLGVLSYSLLQWFKKKDICCGIVFLMWLGEGIFGLIEPVFIQAVQSKFIMWLSGLVLVLRSVWAEKNG